MKKTLIFAIILVLALGAGACAKKRVVVASEDAPAVQTLGVQYAAPEPSLTNVRWKLVELNGRPVTFPEHAKPAFILMQPDGTVSGNLGCNLFTGAYTLREGNRISFSKLANTQMMCIDMTVETEMIRVLQIADNYNLSENQLILNRARMAPLARFEKAN